MSDFTKDIAKESKSNFYYAFNLLPAPKRDAMNTVYSFCRQTDDIVDKEDEPEDVKYEKLRKWRIELEKSLSGTSDYFLFNKLVKILGEDFNGDCKLTFNWLFYDCGNQR